MLENLALLPISLGFLSSGAITASDIFVDIAAPGCDSGTGTLADPVCSIEAAIGLASPGDTIRIAPGVYLENVTLPFDVELRGLAGASYTVLDGGGLGSVVTIPSSVSVTIDDLTVTGGNALRGGGVNLEGSLVLKNSTLSGNIASYGGAISAGASEGVAQLTIEECEIVGNSAESFGGYNGGQLAYGGGIYQNGGSLLVTNTTISGNRAFAQSGYYYCPFFCNYPDDVGSGGGVFVKEASIGLSNSTISDNSARGWYGNNGTSSGASLGGGLTIRQSLVEMLNCTVSGNFAEFGKSLHVSALEGSRIEHTTIARDRGFESSSWSFSIFVSGDLTFRNCLVAENSARNWGQFATGGFNLFDIGAPGIVDGFLSDIAGTVSSPLPPQLGPLADNGGPTQTHALLLGSLAVDSAHWSLFLPTDQTGASRPIGGAADRGAFETRGFAPDLCNGDGGDQMGCTSCPCDNEASPGTIGGCLNSSGNAARLTASGSPSISLPAMSADDLRLTVSGAPHGSFAVMYSADAIAPGNEVNPCFGLQTGIQSVFLDSLRCVISGVRRHGGRPVDGNGDIGATNNGWGGSSPPAVGIAQQLGFLAGQTRYFQAQCREDPLLVCMRGLSSTQAVQVQFLP